jgi:hypothetical protein
VVKTLTVQVSELLKRFDTLIIQLTPPPPPEEPAKGDPPTPETPPPGGPAADPPTPPRLVVVKEYPNPTRDAIVAAVREAANAHVHSIVNKLKGKVP